MINTIEMTLTKHFDSARYPFSTSSFGMSSGGPPEPTRVKECESLTKFNTGSMLLPKELRKIQVGADTLVVYWTLDMVRIWKKYPELKNTIVSATVSYSVALGARRCPWNWSVRLEHNDIPPAVWLDCLGTGLYSHPSPHKLFPPPSLCPFLLDPHSLPFTETLHFAHFVLKISL